MKHILAILLTVTTFSGFSQAKPQSFDEMLKTYYKYTVPLIYPHQLYKMMVNGETFNILDTRNENEYQVSFINGALRIGYDDFSLKKVSQLNKSTKVIVYCTIGARSEQIGEKLKKNGFSKVYNLYGGIIHWKNQGYPTYNSTKKKTPKVHVYSEEWGKWLRKGNPVF